ncbi:MAG: succinate dehydrogenase cytochrome b558 subunit [Chitinivibrionia bacterium]|nr:succinate dehydrogenase cytochrome b558 subunit [Chitinivibrionia bacterium]
MSSTALDKHFVWRKLHSLLGIVPIGFFLCFHLFENSLTTKGPEYFTEHVVNKIGEMPYIELMEIFFIAIPILFHAIYGLVIWYFGQSNVARYGYARNWMYLLQRVSGAVVFVFIITHVWGTRLEVLMGDSVTKATLFEHLAKDLQNPLILAWYIIGVLLAIVHFSNGVWLALITWGITIGPRSQRISSWVCVFIGLVLVALSAQALRGLLAAGV